MKQTPSVEGRWLLHGTIRKTFSGLVRASCRPTITGLENVPDEGGFIVASNHLSFFDSVLMQGLFPRPVTFFAKAEYFTGTGVKGRAMKTFFEAVGSVPVDRSNSTDAVGALFGLGKIVESGSGVGIYPEGTRSRDGRLYRGKNGVGWLALATGAPVIPVGLKNTQNLQPPDTNGLRPAKFSMHVGEPLQFEHMGQKHPMKPRKQATEQIMDAIAELSGQERVASYNARPAEKDDPALG